MDIVAQTKEFVTTHFLPFVTRKQLSLFTFGLQALCFTPYKSLGSNARLIIENVNTANAKMFRLVGKKTMIHNFRKILVASGLVNKHSYVNVDFSTFCGFQALVFAVQTHMGRALPVWNNSLTYPIEHAGSQNIFVLDEIKAFGKTLGFFPRFVFDRGFWIPCVMKFFLREKIPFYLRIKAGQHLEWVRNTKRRKKKGKKRKNKKLRARVIGQTTKDARITLFGYHLRLIISPPPPKQINKKKKQNTQRWYILTNDMQATREEILTVYKTRFEIEEAFRDIKHIQDLKVLHLKTIQSFTILLWFATLSLWLSYWRESRTHKKEGQKVTRKIRSFFRIYWEELQRAIRIEVLQQLVGTASPG